MKEYLNIEGLKETIRKIYDAQIESYKDEPYFECTIYADEDIVEDEVNLMAERLNADMKKYLHQDSHQIVGNFNNVECDYIYNDKRGSYDDFRDMVRRLDEGVKDDQTNEDRDWLTAWFWQTFGTFGLEYNFQHLISEALSVAAWEDEELEINK